MDCTNIIKAIKARCSVFNNHVYGAFEYQNLTQRINPSSLPACYVFTASETAEKLQGTETDYYQTITARIAVIVLCDSGDERGQDGADIMATCQKALFGALLGWSPLKDDNLAILSYDGCANVSNNPAIVATQFTFLCTYELNVSDTFIPTLLSEGSELTGERAVGRLDTMDVKVDLIEHDTKAPDGNIETEFTIEDLNPKESE